MSPSVKRFSAVLAAMIAAAAPAAAHVLERVTTDAGTVKAISGHVLVRYRDGRVASARGAVAKAFGVAPRASIAALRIDTVPVPKGETIASFIRELEQNPDVEFAEPDGIVHASYTPSDFNATAQYSLTTGQINAEAAWDITKGDPSVVIAVIDTGITFGHSDLANQLWNNPNSLGCDSNAHTCEGLHGTQIRIDWLENGNCTDTVSSDPDLASVGPDQCESETPTDDNGPPVFSESIFHGTRVSSIAAAEANNGTGTIVGVAFLSKIMAVKALNAYGNGSFESITEAIYWAVNHGAKVINMSLGGPSSSQAMAAAVAYANQQGVVVVAAAGNTDTLTPNSCGVDYPGAYDGVIAVGATDQNHNLATFSCVGPQVDVSAPGVAIKAAVPPNSYDVGDGTSFASPIVAGVAALVRTVAPTLSPAEVAKYIDFTADQHFTGGGFNNDFGFGIVDAAAAVNAALNRKQFVTNPAYPNDTFAYPNPYRPTSGIPLTFAAPSSPTADGLKITIINAAGERVRTLSGTNSWDGTNDSGSPVASGYYFFLAKTSNGTSKGHFTLIR